MATSHKKQRRGRPASKPNGRFGKLLTRRMAEAGLTQSALAEKTGIPQPRISDFCRGEADPRLEQLEKMAKALGTTVDVLKPKEE